MRRLHSKHWSTVLAPWFIVVGLVFGCESENTDTNQQQNQVDPRFATLDAFVEYLNDMWYHCSVDIAHPDIIYYPETKDHEKLLQFERDYYACLQLEAQVNNQFGKPIFEKMPELFEFKPLRKPVKVISRNGRRAEGTATLGHGPEYSVQFIKMDNRWWVSCYSIEYAPTIKGNRERFEKWARIYGRIAEIVPALKQRLNEGQFASYENFRDELSKHIRHTGP